MLAATLLIARLSRQFRQLSAVTPPITELIAARPLSFSHCRQICQPVSAAVACQLILADFQPPIHIDYIICFDIFHFHFGCFLSLVADIFTGFHAFSPLRFFIADFSYWLIGFAFFSSLTPLFMTLFIFLHAIAAVSHCFTGHCFRFSLIATVFASSRLFAIFSLLIAAFRLIRFSHFFLFTIARFH